MKNIISACKILFATLIISNINFSQTQNNLDYFPHNDGDMWEYSYSDGPFYHDIAQVFNKYDSTDVDGNIYFTQTSRYINPIRIPAVPFSDTVNYKIDTLNQVWAHFGEVEYGIAFKLDAKQGDQWILNTYYDNGEIMGYEMAHIRTIYERNIFGNLYTVMNTYYYFAPASTDTLGLIRYEEEFAKGLGRIWRGGGDSPGRMDIRGAVIGGVLYGDTTNIITSVEKHKSNILPSTLELKQNYPNPFNPTTTIEYSVPSITANHYSHIQLKVYDILGGEVKVLVNKNQHPGKYQVSFDGSELPSGMYFYKLDVGDYSQTKKMLLLK